MKKFYEKDLEEIIFNATDEQLEERGLELHGKRLRQTRITGYGKSDLIFVDKTCFDFPPFYGYLSINIVELKEDKIGVSAFLQAIGYAKGIKRYMEHRNILNYTIKITLIGSEIDKSGSLCFIPDLFYTYVNDEMNCGYISGIDFYSYDYGIDGIMFKNETGYINNNDPY